VKYVIDMWRDTMELFEWYRLQKIYSELKEIFGTFLWRFDKDGILNDFHDFLEENKPEGAK